MEPGRASEERPGRGGPPLGKGERLHKGAASRGPHPWQLHGLGVLRGSAQGQDAGHEVSCCGICFPLLVATVREVYCLHRILMSKRNPAFCAPRGSGLLSN